MKQNYQDCLSRVLQDEGGYTNDPRDPGGATNYGITIADYRMYVNSSGTPKDVKNMTQDQAKVIYKSKYWDKVNGDNLPSGVDYTVFDYGVNSGVGRSNKVYNKLKQTDSIKTINAINDERLSFLHSLGTWSTFGKGWGPRVGRVRQHSIDLANKSSVIAHPANIGILATIATAAASYWTHYWPEIVGGAVILAILISIGIELYKRNK